MPFAKTTFIFLFLILGIQSASAQNLTIGYQHPDSLFVCGTDTFSVTVFNNSALPATDIKFTLTLPEGIIYIAGSVDGATEFNVDDLHMPAFAIPSIQGNASLTIKVLIHADCMAADLLDAGQLFIAGLQVSSPGGTAAVTTSPFTVETGLLLIDSVDPVILSGEKGDTLYREICVKNTRLGKIGNLRMTDQHQPGLQITVAGAANQNHTPTGLQADFSGSFFSAFGDGDNWLEMDEKACFTEQIVVEDCGIPPYINVSNIIVGWGCGNEVCRFDSAAATVHINTSTKIPMLTFSPVWAPPTDNCGNTPAITGIKIVNEGHADATDVYIRFQTLDSMSNFGIGIGSFIMVHNGASTSLSPVLSANGVLTACGLSVYKDAAVVVPAIGTGDSLLILFDSYSCTEPCRQALPLYGVEYFYQKDCPENGFVSDTLLIVPDDRYHLSAAIGTQIGTCLISGTSYPFQYKVSSKHLLGNDGFLHLELELPLGLSLDTTCLATLGGVNASFDSVTSLPDGGYNIHFGWALPLPGDSLEMDFCLRYICDTNIVCQEPEQPDDGTVIVYTGDCPVSCFLPIASKSWWAPELNTPFECAIGECDSMRVAILQSCSPPEPDDGNGDTTIIDIIFPLPGLTAWFDVYRLNLGYQDDDDNRRADSPGAPPASAALVRRDRFLPGDTLRVMYGGAVDSGGALVKFGRTIWHEVVGSDMLTQGNDQFLTAGARNTFSNSQNFRYIGDSIHIRYADGSEAGCRIDDLKSIIDKGYFTVNQVNTYPPVAVDDISTQRFRFEFSLQDLFDDGCLPKGTLDFGDSIFVYTDFRIDLNFRPQSSNQPDPPLVGFRTALSAGGKRYAYDEQPHRSLQYSGFRTTKTPHTFNIRPCEPSVEVKKFRFSL
ncbi:MAG: DUF11 domain-containing protein, partial [Saprospiraceae bacterium]|nr:DUF11 domain-containing protein [Saprospiraceae bacterium]